MSKSRWIYEKRGSGTRVVAKETRHPDGCITRQSARHGIFGNEAGRTISITRRSKWS